MRQFFTRRFAFDAPLVRDILQIFVRTVFASIRRRAGIPASNRQARCRAVSFIQRFGDALNLNVHFHTLALDGIYIVNEKGEVVFQHVAPPSDGEVAVVGVPDEEWGEAVAAFVVMSAEAPLDATAVTAHCKRQLASYKKPRYVLFVDSLPRITSAKVSKDALRA